MAEPKQCADVADGIKATGVYKNRSKQQYEAWAYNERTGETKQLATMTYEYVRSFPAVYDAWERTVWTRFLGSAPN